MGHFGPFDPSILLKYAPPPAQQPSFAESYKFGLTLRDLADRRRIQEQQYQQNQLEMEQRRLELARAKEDWDATQRIIAGFTSGELGENPTLAQLASKGNLSAALKVNQALQSSRTASLQTQKTQSELATAQRAARVAQQQEVADTLYGVRSIQDPEKRQAAMDELAMQDLMKPEAQRLGIQREGEPTPLAEPEFQRRYAIGYTPEKLQALLSAEAEATNKRTKEALDIDEKQLKQAVATSPLVTDQATYTTWRKALPVHIAAQIPEKYSPAAVQIVNRMGLTAEQREDDWTSPGKLIAIATDPDRSAAERARAMKGIELEKQVRQAGAINISPNQTIANEAKLRDDYMRDTKNFVTIRDAYSKILGAAKSQTGPGDISLVYNYMKLLDPGSTVREGEFATAQNAGSIPQRIWAMYNKAVTGERLDPTVRRQFVEEAVKIHSQTRADYLKTRDMYSGIATRSQMDPRNVVIDLERAEVPRGAAPRSGGTPRPATGEIPWPIVDVERGPDGQLKAK